MSDDTIRLDKWLWQARFAKTRSLAQALIEGGKARVNGAPCLKPGRAIRPGDVLTLRLDGGVQLLTVIASGSRRGPATEAATLYRIHDDPLGGVE